MTTPQQTDPKIYVTAIRHSGLTIYDAIVVGDPVLWIPTPELEVLLDEGLRGLSLSGLPLRTRSKVVKERVCQILGYPVPASFKKTQPRFAGQLFDTYVQKSNNLQIWNEELSSTRRYILIRVSNADIVTRVKAVTGDTLALLDTTGTLTKKYQAKCVPASESSELVVAEDTVTLRPVVSSEVSLADGTLPNHHPAPGTLLSIRSIFGKLSALLGKQFPDAGHDQERNRGAILHRMVCEADLRPSISSRFG